jgi:Skp family chaperone for outer membrane proteins
MRRIFVFAFGLACATMGFAQETTQPAGKQPRLAVLDLDRVANESVLGKEYAGRLETLQKVFQAEGQKRQAELNRRDERIKTLGEQFQKEQGVLSDEAAQQKQDEIVKLQREREIFRQDSQTELERLQERAQRQADTLSGELRGKLAPYVESVVKERGIDLLVDRRVCVTADAAFDVSAEVIRRADEAHRSGATKATPVAPKPAAAAPKPAAPAAKPGVGK